MNSPQADDPAVQSLIDAVTEGGGDELAALHRTAAAAHTALQSAQPIEPAPDRLRERLRADADKFAVAPKSKIVRLDFSRAGWLAAAACLVLSCFLWVRQTGPSPALANAGLKITDMKTIKSHNPFCANDLNFCKKMGNDINTMNNYGSSLIYGHPQAPTGGRIIAEMLEETAMLGGGFCLWTGCAAGDTGASLVFKVDVK